MSEPNDIEERAAALRGVAMDPSPCCKKEEEPKGPIYCCFCKTEIHGTPNFDIPEGFPHNPLHEGKPLCDECGGKPIPSLEEICAQLDREYAQEVKDRLLQQLQNSLVRCGFDKNELLSLPVDMKRIIMLMLTRATINRDIAEAKLQKLEKELSTKGVATVPLRFGDVSSLSVDWSEAVTKISIFQRGEEEDKPLITADLTFAERLHLRSVLGGSCCGSGR